MTETDLNLCASLARNVSDENTGDQKVPVHLAITVQKTRKNSVF
jgi:hypothetical protein